MELGEPRCYRAFTARPFAVINQNGEVLDTEHWVELLKQKIRLVHEIVELEYFTGAKRLLRAYMGLQDEGNLPSSVNRAGSRLGVGIPDFLNNEFPSGTKGNSRWGDIIRAAVVTPLSSWAERVRAVEGTSDKHISQGWYRTMNANPPTLYPKISMGASDKQQTWMETNDESFAWWMALDNQFVGFVFPLDSKRFTDPDGVVTLPDLQLNESGGIDYRFTWAVPYTQGDVSERYVIGVDVGKVEFAAAAAWDTVNHKVAGVFALSQRARDLDHSIKATTTQVANLHRRIDRLLKAGQYATAARANAEIVAQRKKNSRKKRELAILVAQELASFAADWGNALVAVEDLSWVANTMQNGRWNRGALVKWLRHFVELNGSRVLTVSSYRTSQLCSECSKLVTHDMKRRLVKCSCGLLLDRDVNAAINVAKRGVRPAAKTVVTRKKSKRYRPGTVRRSITPKPSLKHPGRDRSKNAPTPRQKKHNKTRREVIPVVKVYGPPSPVSGTVLGDTSNQSNLSCLGVQFVTQNNPAPGYA